VSRPGGVSVLQVQEEALSTRLVAAAIAALVSSAAAQAAPPKAAPPAKPDSDKPWKVEDAHGPSSTVSFTTEEGTWLHLDVHPDGTQLVFSILGDLYLLPIAGGEAKRITSGPAYDVQPRFSPDGQWIAFASDRGGLENLWIADREGKNARPISAEKGSPVNGPAWSPDGQYLVGRKRLTDTSSLGTVELWMWHVKGGDGIQLTKKDEQPDAADPAFSPDGRFLYYSARPGRYKYDSNVNSGIWQIKRLDRRTGQALPLTGEFGGAAVPTPSPDGKQVAYVRRVRAKTRLEVIDLATGRTRVVAPEVERDGQEGFASHGVTPGFDWTPDGKAILATAQGRIWRFDAESGTRTAVPFKAAVEQRVTDALRFPHPVDSETVRARILRWPVESPDGKRLVFSAVGRLYEVDLPSGTPKRLTSGSDLEYSPAFSPDGRQVAYVTWNDKEGGHVWVLAAGGAARRVTQEPAQYANPSFSPDGKNLVYLRGSGATFRGNDPGDELWHEIRWSAVEGGASHYVIGVKNRGQNRRMARPTFSADGQRIFYLDDEDGKPSEVPKTVLSSVRLDGTDMRAHLRWPKAEEAAVSPDARYVAFSELHNAYVTAMPDLYAGAVDVSADKGALPVGKLTDEGGEWMGWADGGKTVTWIFGPVYHRIALDKALPTPEPEAAKPAETAKKDEKKKADGDDKAKDEKKKLPESQKVEIVLNLPRPRPNETVAYKGARIVTMKGDEVVENGTIVVEGNRIKAVGPAASVAVPAGARTVDVAGRTIVPGFIDEHAHLHYSTLDVFPQRPWKYLANLAYGVTTTHDPSASTHEAFGQSEMVEAGIMTGPRIYSTGFILYGADSPGRAVIESLDDARKHVRRLKSLGAFSVKSYMQPRREQRQWVIQAAREEGMLVVPEGGGDLEFDMSMILDGHTTIEHSLPQTPLYNDVVTLFSKSQTAYTPTLLVAYGGISGDKWFHQHYELWKDERLQRVTPQAVVDSLGRIRSIMATDPADWHHVDVAASAKKVADAGGRVCLGGHGQMQGIGPHWEVWAFVQGGMPPLQALRVATRWPAESLGIDKDLGSLEAGKLADFMVLEKNPLEKIENSETIELVVKNGTAYAPKDLALTQ
jgi:Tol biopolymer transport system component/imidazolonepropionase-like amidohydrolase